MIIVNNLLVSYRKVIIGTIVSYLTQFDKRYHVAVVGTIKRGLPPPSVPPFEQISYLLVPALTIAVVSLCISISMGKMFSRKHGYKVSSNQVYDQLSIVT
jgi:MFS superfamily sulfate permease-like transporter